MKLVGRIPDASHALKKRFVLIGLKGFKQELLADVEKDVLVIRTTRFRKQRTENNIKFLYDNQLN